MHRPYWPKEIYIYVTLITIVGVIVSGFCAVISSSYIWGIVTLMECMAVYWLAMQAKKAH